MFVQKLARTDGAALSGLRTAIRGVPRVIPPLQVAALVAMVAMVGTRGWQHHLPEGFALAIVATAIWAPDLARQSSRRWWFWYVAGIFLYTLLRSLADETNIPVRTAYPINFDDALFFGNNPTQALQRWLFRPPSVSLVDWAAVLMHWSFFIAPHLVALVLFLRKRELFPRFTVAMLLTWYAGLALFVLVPTAPPWLAANSGALPGTFRVMDFVGGQVSEGAYNNVTATFGEPNSVAAMPSLHMAITFVLILWAFSHGRRLGLLAGAYGIAMAFSLLYLGEHYLADMLVGVAVAIGGFAAARRWVPVVPRLSEQQPQAARR